MIMETWLSMIMVSRYLLSHESSHPFPQSLSIQLHGIEGVIVVP